MPITDEVGDYLSKVADLKSGDPLGRRAHGRRVPAEAWRDRLPDIAGPAFNEHEPSTTCLPEPPAWPPTSSLWRSRSRAD